MEIEEIDTGGIDDAYAALDFGFWDLAGCCRPVVSKLGGSRINTAADAGLDDRNDGFQFSNRLDR
jgi:hypothetical protein